MAKMTVKYGAALVAAIKQGLPRGATPEDLYQALQNAGWFWDSKQKTWLLGNNKPAQR